MRLTSVREIGCDTERNKMFLYFIDESGDPGNPKACDCTRILVLGGIIIPEREWRGLAEKLKSLKAKYGLAPMREVKWRDVRKRQRYESTRDDLKNLNDNARREFAKALLGIIGDSANSRIIVEIIDKEKAYQKGKIPDAESLYREGLMHLMERFQYFLNNKSEFGVVILDSRTGQQDQRIRLFFQSMFERGTRWTKFPKIIECAFLTPSDFSVGIQFADFVVGAFYVWKERRISEFYDIIKGKITGRPHAGKRDGLKFWP